MRKGKPRQNKTLKKNAGIALDEELIAQLEAIAAANEISRSQLADYIFRNYLGLECPYSQYDLQLMKLGVFE